MPNERSRFADNLSMQTAEAEDADDIFICMLCISEAMRAKAVSKLDYASLTAEAKAKDQEIKGEQR